MTTAFLIVLGLWLVAVLTMLAVAIRPRLAVRLAAWWRS